MTRPSTGPDAGADDEDPSAAGADNGHLNRSMILQTAKDRDFAHVDQKLRHGCASGQGADEVAAA